MAIVTLLFGMLFALLIWTCFRKKYCYINEKSIPIRMLFDMLIHMIFAMFLHKKGTT